MHTSSRRHPTVDSSVRVVIPRYLIYFAIPPIVTAFVISVVDPYAGLAMLANVAVMAVVLRILSHAERSGRRSPDCILCALADIDPDMAVDIEHEDAAYSRLDGLALPADDLRAADEKL